MSSTLDMNSPRGPLVLVVDDDDGVRSMLDDQLTSLGYRTVCARSAEEALAACPGSTSASVSRPIPGRR